jgi:hypothetical protein
MKKLSFWAFAATVLCLAAPVFAETAFPTWTDGNSYDMNEAYVITTPLVGDGGYIRITGQTHYTVNPVESVTQTKGSVTADCWKVSFDSSHVSGTGQVVIEALSYSGPARFTNGSLSGAFYLKSDDLAAVVKNRIIEGDAEILTGGSWFSIGTVTITENEEYDGVLHDMKFPATVGDTWNETNHVYTYGSYAAVVGTNTFETDFTWTVTYNTSDGGPKTIEAKGDCNTMLFHGVADSGAELSTYYCPDSLWFAVSQMSHIPLGSDATAGEIRSVDVVNLDYSVVNDQPTPTPTPPVGDTPTPTPPVGDTPTPTPTAGDAGFKVLVNGSETAVTVNSGDSMSLQIAAWNHTGADVTVDIWIAVDIGGAFYFWDDFSTDAHAWVPGIAVPDGLDLPATEIWSFLNEGVGGLTVTWYGAFLDGTGNIVGALSTVPCTLN